MKKINLKKLIASVLICLWLLVSLYSCADNNNINSNNNNTQNIADASEDGGTAEVENVNIYDQFPKTDFGGREMKILIMESAEEEHYVEGEIGEVFNDAVYRRNKKIEEDYNIKLKFVPSSWADHTKDMQKSVMANDKAYDLGVMQSAAGLNSVVNNIYRDWNTVPVTKENLDNPWWNQSILTDLSIANKVFGIAGDIGYSYFAEIQSLVFNKKLFRDAGMEIPYAMVKDGTWTYDAFESLTKNCNRDLNGDGKIEVQDDLFGLVTMTHNAPTVYFTNFGGKAIEKDANDYPVLVLGSELNSKIIDTGYRWFIEGGVGLTEYTGNDDYTQDLSHMVFYSDRAYFIGTNLRSLMVFRNMESEYGVVPYPKLDTAQNDYISTVDGAATVLMLPKTADDDDAHFVGTIVEALARESSLSVIPAYYETTLQLKFTRDDETIEMLDLLRRTANFDFGYLYNFEGTGRISKTLVEQKSANLASYVEKNEAKIQRAIDKLIQFCEELD